MNFLAARRRHKAAGVVVVLFALVILGGVYSAAVPTEKAEAAAAQSTQIEEGKKLYDVSCATCHGPNGEGISTRGPSLIGVGAASVDFQVGTGRMPAMQPGAQIPAKPPVFDAEETAALAAYVASLGPGPAIPGEEQYSPEGLTDAEIAEGGDLFKTNCAGCHNVSGKGGALPWGKYAPSLDGVSDKHIFEAMLTGPQQMPVFSDGVITPEDKKKIIGYLDTIRSEPSAGGLTLGGLGPVSEGLWGWLIGIGALVVATVWIAARGSKVKKGHGE
ncbi:MAG TPA: cytochrome c [Actinopolymorphaceae bacterium]